MRALAPQTARQPVRVVVQLLDRPLDLLPRLAADVAALVDDARDGHRRHPGPVRDIYNRRPPLLLRLNFYPVLSAHKQYGSVTIMEKLIPLQGFAVNNIIVRVESIAASRPPNQRRER